MTPDDLFHWAGEQLGRLVRGLVAGLSWLFSHLGEALSDFYDGLAGQLGIGHSVISLLGLLVGLALLLSGLRALLAGRLIGFVLRAGLGVLLLGWLIG